MTPEVEPTPQVHSRGLRTILLATVVAGVAGYLLQGLVGRFVTPDVFLRFSVFWSTIYLLVAALSGLQQETARAAHPAPTDKDAPGRVLGFGVVCALGVGVLITATSPLWAGLIFPTHPVTFVLALVIGAAGYVGVALMGGLFYGVKAWPAIAGAMIVDALLRLVFVSGALLAEASLDIIAAAVVLPFPLTLGLLWLATRARVKGRYVLDVPPSRLAWNATRAVGGSISTGVLTSGYPLLIGATSTAEPEAIVGALVFVVTITRAPLVIPALTLQSFLTVHFRERTDAARSRLLRLLAGVVVISLLLAAVAFVVEPWLLRTIWGEGYVVSAAVCAGIVLTSGVTAGLCVSGAATLASSRHGAFVAGWGVAAVASVVLLFLPVELEARVLISMGVGPLLGVMVHLLGMPVPDRDGSRA